MQRIKLLLSSLLFVGLAALAGCSFPKVYKIDIQQGNVVTQDMIDQLKPGMTRRQVRFVMGNPLITDTFHANRWDYLYSLQPGKGKSRQERVSLIFDENDKLASLSGDFRPGVSRDDSLLGTPGADLPLFPREPGAQPAAEPGPLAQQPGTAEADQQPSAGSALEAIQRELDEAKTAKTPEPGKIED